MTDERSRAIAVADKAMVCAIVALALSVSYVFALYFLRGDPFRPDYSVFWTAARVAWSDPASLYDTDFITEAQSWLVEPARGARPWAYPPSTLIVLMPFAILPFWLSYLCWVATTGGLYLAAVSRFVSSRWLVLAAASPPAVIAGVSGQTSLLVAALGLGALSLPKDKSFRSGLLLGIAAAIKPQSVIVAPFFLIDRKGWVGFATGGALMVGLSVLLGPSLWVEWVAALPTFASTAATLGLVPFTPSGLAIRLGINPAPLMALGTIAGVSLALVCRNGDKWMRSLGLFGGGPLITPYAMLYDLVGLAPLVIIALSRLWAGEPLKGYAQERGKAALGTV